MHIYIYRQIDRFSPSNKQQYHRHDIGTTYSQKDLPIPHLPPPPENTSKP